MKSNQENIFTDTESCTADCSRQFERVVSLHGATIHCADFLDVLKEIPDQSIELVIVDPPYKENFVRYFEAIRRVVKQNGSILWFVNPEEIWTLPQAKQVMIWIEPSSPKPIRKRYNVFADLIAWYAYGDYTFNKLLWNLMDGKFDDNVIDYKRRHKWQKPRTLLDKLILVHSNEGDTIFEPFCGSGVGCESAIDLKRKYIGCEIDKDEYGKAIEHIRAVSN